MKEPKKLSDAMQAARLEVSAQLESARLDVQQAKEEYDAFQGDAQAFEALHLKRSDALRRAQNMEAAQQKMHEIIALLHGAPGEQFLAIGADGTLQELSREDVKQKQREQRLQRMNRRGGR